MRDYRDIGFKLTPQRIAILDYLYGNKKHPSAEEIFAAVSKKFPTMSFATVYNTLIALTERGIVVDLTIDTERKRFDPNTEPHNHLICSACKRVVDVDMDFDFELPGSLNTDFIITGKHVEFYGICSRCRATDI